MSRGFGRPSSKWMELEDRSTLSRFHRMVEIDLIDDANEIGPERYASRERTKSRRITMSDQCVEVAAAGCREEGVDQLTLAR